MFAIVIVIVIYIINLLVGLKRGKILRAISGHLIIKEEDPKSFRFELIMNSLMIFFLVAVYFFFK